MNRRTLLASALAFGLIPSLALAGKAVDYTPGAIQKALAAGKTVFVDYAASWCGTCRRQARVIEQLRAENPAYDKAMVFFRVDWDTYRSHSVTTSRDIPRRSTLILLRGDKEIDRVVAETGAGRIKAMMDKGL